MQTAIYKFLALSGVIALGCFVVYQVHTRIPPVGETVTPDDFRSVADDEHQDDSESRSVAADSSGAGPLPVQHEADSVSRTSQPDEARRWEALPLQSESDPVPDSATIPAGFWSEDPTRATAEDAPALLPGFPAEADHSPDPLNDPGSHWSADGLPDSSPVPDSSPDDNRIEPDEAVVAPGRDRDAPPRTLSPIENVQPLPGAFVPEDDPDWAPDQPTEAIADHDLVPVDGVQPSPTSDPFAVTGELSDARGEPDSPELPLLDFQTGPEPEPAPDPGDVADPFSGFSGRPSAVEPVQPVDPGDAGFTGSREIPIPPTVSSNPFAFAESDADPDDTPDAPPIPRLPAARPAPESPPSGVDEQRNDDAGETPGVSSSPFPVIDVDRSDADLELEPRLPVLMDDTDASAPSTDVTSGPFSEMPRDEVSAPQPEPVLPADPFANQTIEPETDSRDADGMDSSMNLELVGDATIDRPSASGPQQPELEIEKIAPPEASVGSPLIYAIHIRNVGRSAAHGVVVEDRIPRGTVLDGTIPQAELTDKVLTWKLGTIEPGREETIRIKVTPTEAGEIGSVATVRFAAEVSAATSITSADLRLDMDGPREVALGETAVFHYTLTNAGDGPARGAYIRCLLPAAFEHPGGADIEYEVGDLQPGQSSHVDLEIRAVEPGMHQARVLLNAGGRTYDESDVSVNVLPSRLLLSREGPARRFVGRPARYSTVVTNRSGVDLTGISIVEQLPEALELAAIPDDGTYDPGNRTITWTIPGLAAGASHTVSSTIVARQYGLHSSTITARDRDGNEAHVTSDLQVAGFSTLEVDWEHDGKPLAVGEQVAMRLTVRNEGTAPARNVQAVFEVPPQLRFVNAQGPVPFQQEGRFVRFDGVGELAINGEQSFDIVLTAAAPGNTRVSAQLLSADHTEPLRHDEPLFILQDEN